MKPNLLCNRLLLCAVLLGPNLPAQDFAPGNEGYVEIVNAVHLKAPTELSFTRAANPAFYELDAGSSTGVMPLYTGEYQIRLRNKLCIQPEISSTLTLAPGTYHTVVLSADLEQRDGKTIPRLHISIISGERSVDEPKLSIVSLSAKPVVNLNVSGRDLAFEARRVRHIPVKMDDQVSIKQGRKTIATAEITTPVMHIVFLYDQPGTGTLGHVLIRQTLMLPPVLD